jgi:uncharacterized protein YdeI (YjbR/CyaY-like superfamily)
MPSMPSDIEVPELLRKEFEKNPDAYEAFQDMDPAHQRQYLLFIGETSNEEIQKKRIRQLIGILL